MCFAPQQRALFFRHLNFQRCSGHGVFCTFWLRNVLRAKTACTFSTSQLPKVLPRCEVFCAFWLRNLLRATTVCNFWSLICPDGSASAALASLLFNPPEPQNIGKTLCFATFLPFRAPASSFFWLFLFSSLLFASLLFSSLLWLFPPLLFICPCCRKFDFWTSSINPAWFEPPFNNLISMRCWFVFCGGSLHYKRTNNPLKCRKHNAIGLCNHDWEAIPRISTKTGLGARSKNSPCVNSMPF